MGSTYQDHLGETPRGALIRRRSSSVMVDSLAGAKFRIQSDSAG
jgi:hypothetical protein